MFVSNTVIYGPKAAAQHSAYPESHHIIQAVDAPWGGQSFPKHRGTPATSHFVFLQIKLLKITKLVIITNVYRCSRLKWEKPLIQEVRHFKAGPELYMAALCVNA